jgi:hypothetical protein
MAAQGAVDMLTVKQGLAPVVAALLAATPALPRAEAPAAPALADDPTLIALAVALACADAPDAHAAPPPASAGPAGSGPQLELVATVQAKTLRFDEVPKVNVVFRGTGERKTVWRTERVNLPVHPQPGVTYHDVQVRLTISSDPEELGSLLHQAKTASRGVRIENDPPPVKAAPASAPVAPAAPATHAPARTGAADAPKTR